MADQEFKLNFTEAHQLVGILEFATCFVNSEHAQPAFELQNKIQFQLDGKSIDDARKAIAEWNAEHGSLHRYREKQDAARKARKQKAEQEQEQEQENPSPPWWKFWSTT